MTDQVGISTEEWYNVLGRRVAVVHPNVTKSVVNNQNLK